MSAITYERSKRVDLRMVTELLPELIEHLPLLGAKMVGTRTEGEADHCVVEPVLDQAPAEAAEMNPTFVRFLDGSVGVQSVEWFRANGTWITTTEPA